MSDSDSDLSPPRRPASPSPAEGKSAAAVAAEASEEAEVVERSSGRKRQSVEANDTAAAADNNNDEDDDKNKQTGNFPLNPNQMLKSQVDYYFQYAASLRDYCRSYPMYEGYYVQYAQQYEDYARSLLASIDPNDLGVDNNSSKKARTDENGAMLFPPPPPLPSMSNFPPSLYPPQQQQQIEDSAAPARGIDMFFEHPSSSNQAQDDNGDYATVGHFNRKTGKFEQADAKKHDNDRAWRQMQHYFDYDAWAKERNAAAKKVGGVKVKTRL